MADESKVTAAKSFMDTMTALELYETIEYAAKVRKSRPCGFLELPPELRNRLYGLCIEPEDVDKHALKRKAPALLHVNQQVSSEFGSVYYSASYIHAEFYTPATDTWNAVQDSKVLHAIFGQSSSLALGTPRNTNFLKGIVASVELNYLTASGNARGVDSFRYGVLKLGGINQGRAVDFYCYIPWMVLSEI